MIFSKGIRNIKNLKFIAIWIHAVFLLNCGSANSVSTPCSEEAFSVSKLPTVGSTSSGNNIVPITVNGTLCGDQQYINELCTSVTICSTSDPSNCQTINNILLDTGSVGLRIFSSVITVPLTPITQNSMTLAECVQFGDGSSEWGKVKYAYIKLGNEPAVATPILTIDSKYSSPPDICSSSQSIPDVSPQQVGFNGILGVGLFAQDCGSFCQTSSSNQQYFSCTDTKCNCGATVDLSTQLQNPVALLPIDNNGLLIQLPSVSSSRGVKSLSGSMILGIGTQENNTPSGVTTFTTDLSGNFTTTFSAYSSVPMGSSFIDSGSSDLFFPAPSGGQLPDCGTQYGSNLQGLYCPVTAQNFTAQNKGKNGAINTVSFQIDNAYTLISTSNFVFNNMGGSSSSAFSAAFDWGLPFFFGRNVYVGIEKTSSVLGTGPYWAY